VPGMGSMELDDIDDVDADIEDSGDFVCALWRAGVVQARRRRELCLCGLVFVMRSSFCLVVVRFSESCSLLCITKFSICV
jgi:hypothetical protein